MTMLQLPVPPASVIVQGESPPVSVTVPVAVVDPPVTETETLTVCPGLDGLGVWAVMVVVVIGKFTECPVEVLLVLWLASPE